jgi:hypothetical protein
MLTFSEIMQVFKTEDNVPVGKLYEKKYGKKLTFLYPLSPKCHGSPTLCTALGKAVLPTLIRFQAGQKIFLPKKGKN